MTDYFQDQNLPLLDPLSLPQRLGPGFWLSLGWILLLVTCALLADFFPLPELDHMDWDRPASPMGTRADIPVFSRETSQYESSSFVYLLGTDALGRDILTRLVFGARVSLIVGVVSPLLGGSIGCLLGMAAGFYRGRVEGLIMSVMDAILAFPGLVLLLLVVFHFGPGLTRLIPALGFLTIPAFTRVARANTLKCAQGEFITAARALGQKDLYILALEILPNIVMPMLIYGLLVVSYMIVAEGALSFLGLGVTAPTPSWGSMIAEGKELLDEAAHVSLIPALIMFFTILSFNIIGDALRGVLDTRGGQI